MLSSYLPPLFLLGVMEAKHLKQKHQDSGSSAAKFRFIFPNNWWPREVGKIGQDQEHLTHFFPLWSCKEKSLNRSLQKKKICKVQDGLGCTGQVGSFCLVGSEQPQGKICKGFDSGRANGVGVVQSSLIASSAPLLYPKRLTKRKSWLMSLWGYEPQI